MCAAPEQLREYPFGEVADPTRFYASSVHETVCVELLTALRVHRGLILLTGEPGTGKTMVLRRVTRDLEASGGQVLRCDDPADLDRMLATFARQLGVHDPTLGDARGDGPIAVETTSLGGATVVAIDEAQRLGPLALARLRALAASWTDAGRPLAILLVGQPELAARLAHLDRQGADPSVRLVLPPLPASEVGRYVTHQLDGAESYGGAVFEPDAIARVTVHADGIPRVINDLCAGALRAASLANVTTVSAPMVDRVARQFRAPFARGRAARALGRLGDRQPRVANLRQAVAIRLDAVRRSAAAVGHGVTRGLAATGRRAGVFGHDMAQRLRATGRLLGDGIAHQLRATGRRAAILGHGVRRQLHATRRRAARVGRGLAATGRRAGVFGHDMAQRLRATGRLLGDGIAHQLRATGRRAAILGHGVRRQLHATRRRAAHVGRGLAATGRRAGVFGHDMAQRLRATGRLLGDGIAHQLRATGRRAAILGHGVRRQLHATRRRAAHVGRGLAQPFRVPRRRSPVVDGGIPQRLRVTHRRSPGGRARAWAARAGVTAILLVTTLLALRQWSFLPPPVPPAAPPTQVTGLRHAPPSALPPPRSRQPAAEVPPSTPVAPRVARPASPGTRERPPEVRARASEPNRATSPAPPSGPSPSVNLADSGRERARVDAAGTREMRTVERSPSVRDRPGATSLMAATIRGDEAMAELLLASGVNVNDQDEEGLTALMVAARDGHAALLQQLLDRGAIVDVRMRLGWTALAYAARKGHPDIARRLLRAGADPTLRDRSGWTALMHASSQAAEIGTDEPLAKVDSLRMRGLASVEIARRRYGELVDLLGGATMEREASRR